MLKRYQRFSYQRFLPFFCQLSLIVGLYMDNIDLTIPNSTQFVPIYGPGTSYFFGYKVNKAGDFNDDGFDDVIIGSPSSSLKGIAYLIYGHKDGISDIDLTIPLTSTQGFQIEGEALGDYLGSGVDSAGDFNGDGISDIILGAPFLPGGAAYVIFGSKTLPSILNLPGDLVGRGFKVTGTQLGGVLGTTVACAGDVNGDGLSDIIIGASGEGLNGAGSGSAYVIFGRRTDIIDLTVPTDLTSDRGFYVQGTPGNALGVSVNSAGDVNADGIDDIIIAGQNPSTGGGDVYIIFGRKTGFTNYDLTSSYSYIANDISKIQSVAVGASFNGPIDTTGDINEDGIDDVAIAVSAYSSMGATYIIFGNKNGDLNIDMTTGFDSSKGFAIYGANSGDMLGSSLAHVGDFNGDGIDDLAVAAMGANFVDKTFAGAVYLIYGWTTNPSNINLALGLGKTEGIKIQGTDQFSGLGFSMGSAGDFNGDGAPDIIVASPYDSNPGGTMTGAVFILFGVPVPSSSPPSDPVPVREPTPVETIVQVQSAGAVANQAAATALFFANINTALPLLFAFLVDILFYVRYLEIIYPPRLRSMLEQPSPQYISISCITSAPEQLANYLPVHNIPEKFEFYGFDSSFLVNFWPSLITFLIVLVIIIIALLLEYATRSKKWLNEQCQKFKQSMKWNYLIAMFTGYFSDIALYTFLEMTTVEFGSFMEVLSFITCLFVNLLAIFMLVQMFFIIKKLRATKHEIITKNETHERLEKLKTDLEGFEVIFNGYKDDSFLQQSYLLLFSLRFYIFYVIVAYLFAHPIVQTVLISVMGLIVLFYVALKRPFQDKKDFIMSLTQEMILQVVNISALGLAVTDDGETGTVRVLFGDIIIGCNIAFMIVGLVYTIVSITLVLRDFYKYIKKKLAEKKAKKGLAVQNIKVRTSRDMSQLPVLRKNPANGFTSGDESQHTLNVSSFMDPNNPNHADIHLTEITQQERTPLSPQKRSRKSSYSELALHNQKGFSHIQPRRIQIDQNRDQKSNQKTLSSSYIKINEPSNNTETLQYVSNMDLSNGGEVTSTNSKSMSLYYQREKALRKI